MANGLEIWEEGAICIKTFSKPHAVDQGFIAILQKPLIFKVLVSGSALF
jgi:hypothetical protein